MREKVSCGLSRNNKEINLVNGKNKKLDKELPKWMKALVQVFFFLSYANAAMILRKISRKNAFLKWCYMFFPFLVLSAILIIMMRNNVFMRMDGKYTYLLDMSNSVGLTLLFFISYFISGIYTDLFKRTVEVSTSSAELKEFILQCEKFDNIQNKKLKGVILAVAGMLFIVAGTVIGGRFVFNAGTNGLFWIKELYKRDLYGLYFYSIFLGLTWYRSLCLLGLVLSGSLVIYGIIANNIISYENELYNINASVVKLYDMLIYNFSYGIFYIGGSVIFIVNDHISASNFGANSTFTDPQKATILLLIILALVLVAYLPIHELKIYMDGKKMNKIEEIKQLLLSNGLTHLEEENLQRNLKVIMISSPILTTFSNKMIFIVSIFTPIIGIIVQFITS